jgi:hypothetical protein
MGANSVTPQIGQWSGIGNEVAHCRTWWTEIALWA